MMVFCESVLFYVICSEVGARSGQQDRSIPNLFQTNGSGSFWSRAGLLIFGKTQK